MRLLFTKMHALGNDFMVVPRLMFDLSLPPSCIQMLSNRRRGVGFDQLLVLDPPSLPDCDFDYLIYNADGSQSGQCGNGARALAIFIWQKGLLPVQSLRLNLSDRVLSVRPQLPHAAVNMGQAKFSGAYEVGLAGEVLSGELVDVGNPHLICEREFDEAALVRFGRFLNEEKGYDGGINLSFVKRLSPREIEIRTYERGVGLTEACGSAATASAALLHRRGQVESEVTVRLLGGELFVSVGAQGIVQSGEALLSFDGVIEI